MGDKMTIIGFNYSKIEAEKRELAKGKININNNVSISKVDENKLALGNEKQKVLSFTFEFIAKYDPNIGSIKLTGEVLYMGDPNKVKEILSEWKKSKKLPKDIMPNILNTVLNKCNIQALILSERMNLPPPVQLPKLQVVQKQD